MNVSFRPLTADDLPLLHEWLQREHVRRWWDGAETLDGVSAHHLPAIDGREPTDEYLIVLDERPVGFIQTYLVADYPEWAAAIGEGAGVAAVDLLIGEAELTGRGVGTEAIRRFTRDVVFSRPETVACTADVDVENAASLQAFAKAGYRRIRDFVDPESGRLDALMKLDR
jgi:aminoglycoside 6'-N-acetyltransferase